MAGYSKKSLVEKIGLKSGMIMSCFFCQPKNFNNSIHETSHWNILLSWDQTYLGRCVVVLKRHCGDLAELRQKEWTDYISLVAKLETALRKSFGAAMFNWSCLMNDAYKEKNPEPHVHWHFRPRYNKKVEVAGETFEDKAFGHHYERGVDRNISETTKNVIIRRVRECL